MSDTKAPLTLTLLDEDIAYERERVNAAIYDKAIIVHDKWTSLITREYIKAKIVEAQVKGYKSVTLITVEGNEYDREIDYLKLFRLCSTDQKKTSVESLIKSHIDSNNIRVFPQIDITEKFIVYLDWSVLSAYLPTVCYTHRAIFLVVLFMFGLMAFFAVIIRLIVI